MAQLPGIGKAPIPSLGRQDPHGPIRVARAQAAAAASIGAAAKDFSEYYGALQAEEGENKATEALSDLLRQETQIMTNPNIDERQEQIEEIGATIGTTYREGLSRDAEKAFEDRYTKYSSVIYDRMAVNSIAAKNDQVRQQTVDASIEMAYMGHKEEALQRIEESKVLGDREKELAAVELQLQYELGMVERISLNGTPEEIAQLRDGISAETYGGPLKGEQRRAALRQLNSAFVLATAEQTSAEARAMETRASNLEIMVNRGEAGYADVEDAYSAGDITGPKRTQLYLVLDRQNAEEVTLNHAITLVEYSLLNGRPLDNRNRDHQEAVDLWYESIKQEYADDPARQIQHAINVAGRANILPSQIEEPLHTMAMAGGTEQVRQTANLYEILEREAPQTLDRIGSHSKAVYKSYLSMVRAGADPEKSLELARQNAYLPENERSILRTRFQSEVAPDIGSYTETMQSWLNKTDLDVSWSPFQGSPAPTNAHVAAFKSLHQEYFLLTGGDEELSKAMARDDFLRIFSTSQINGNPEVMAYAPDREYGNLVHSGTKDHGPMDLLRLDVKQFMKEHGIENGYILSDELTARGTPGNRTYAVYTQDEGGLPHRTMYRWQPDAEFIKKVYGSEMGEWDKQQKAFQEAHADVIRMRMEEDGW